MSAAVLKPAPKAEETALHVWLYHDLGVLLSRNVLPSVICVTKLVDIVGSLCHVIGEPTLKIAFVGSSTY